jgi:MIP family channel proteins
MNTPLLRAALAEAIGTFALVFAGAGAVMVDAKTHALGHVGVAITFGLVIMAMIYAVGHISGAHFNAAVTFAFALTRHFPWPRAVVYWGAQLIGAVAAALLLRASLGNVAHLGATFPSGSQGQSFVLEFVMTAFLMFVILAVATDTRAVGEAAAIAVGGTIGFDAMFGGPISGASMNPITLPRSCARLRRPACPLALHRRADSRSVGRRTRVPTRPRGITGRSRYRVDQVRDAITALFTRRERAGVRRYDERARWQ